MLSRRNRRTTLQMALLIDWIWVGLLPVCKFRSQPEYSFKMIPLISTNVFKVWSQSR